MLNPKGTREEIAAIILDACARVLTTRRAVVAHHLSKGAIEKWFTFELAAEIDTELGEDWMCLVDRGGKRGKPTVGSGVAAEDKKERNTRGIDLLIKPKQSWCYSPWLEAPGRGGGSRGNRGVWCADALAIEIKQVHLSVSEAGYSNALADDLLKRAADFHRKGLLCAHWLGLQITTDGLWLRSPNREATARRTRQLVEGRLTLQSGLERLGPRLDLGEFRYRDWLGRVWAEVIVKADDAADSERGNHLTQGIEAN